jgi:plasmid replication initiation protein
MAKPSKAVTSYRNEGNPLDPNDGRATMVKPGELIDVREMRPLTLYDRRCFNLLVANAWDEIEEDKDHVIPKSVLRGAHKGNERIRDMVHRLMSTIVEMDVLRDGKKFIRSTHLLGDTDREDGDDESGVLYYNFTKSMRTIIKKSTTYGRLRTEVMFCFTSKYALALYEMMQKRKGLSHKNTDEFSVEEFRKLLGVRKDKLLRFADFRAKAIAPALAELNALGDYHVQIDGVRTGRSITKIRMIWFPKDEQGLKAAYTEVQRHKAGRRARINGTAEVIASPAAVTFDDDLEALP